jgi:hypothetical protein
MICVSVDLRKAAISRQAFVMPILPFAGSINDIRRHLTWPVHSLAACSVTQTEALLLCEFRLLTVCLEHEHHPRGRIYAESPLLSLPIQAQGQGLAR